MDKNKNISIRTIFKKYITRIITALIFWSICYTLIYYIIPQLTTGNPINYKEVILHVILGHSHLWFLYTIICLYIITPLLRKITQSQTLTSYFLILALLFNIFTISPLTAILPGFAKVIQGKLNMFLICGYSSYYVLGYYINSHQISRPFRVTIYLLATTSLFITIFGTHYLSVSNNKLVDILYANLMPNIFFISLAVFISFKEVLSRINYTSSQMKIIKLISDNCFGIYLIHVFVYEYLFSIGIHPSNFNPIISIPVISIMTFVISFSIIYLIASVPALKKYIL